MVEIKSAQEFKEGLEDVVATSSSICYIDGKAGVLSYRGYDIRDLAEHSTFEETCFLLWYGRLPKTAELDDLRRRMTAARAVPDGVMDLLRTFPTTIHPMVALRTAVSALAMYDADAEDNSHEANMRKAIRLTSQIATLTAAIARLREGQEPVPPRRDLSHAANFLHALWGRPADSTSARAMDVALVLHADHEFNASTFAARVTAATLSDMYSAVTSAIGALKGPLHGGANEQVMKMLREIGSIAKAEPYVRSALSQKKKIPGFGHRVYKTEDPRAAVLRKWAEELGGRAGVTKWTDIQARIKQIMEKEKQIYPNVDFYSATVYHLLGIPEELFTPIFAVSRMAGWTAHIVEQQDNNRLIRPLAHYTGPLPPQPFLPPDKR